MKAQALATIAAAGLAAALGFAAPAAAGEERVKKDVVIKRIGPDGKEMRVDGEHARAMLAQCRDGQKAESDVSSGDGKEKFRTRIVICSKDGAASPETRAKLVEALEKARSGLAGESGLSAERRAEAEAALDREIARLKAGN